MHLEHGSIIEEYTQVDQFGIYLFFLIELFTMSRYTDKKVAYKAKDDYPVRFGFEYNENAINYRTEIPSLPEKPKHKPEEKIRDKKLQEVESKIEKLKASRKEKKDEIKRLNSEYDGELESYKQNINLGKKCVTVLDFDKERLNEEIGRKSGKIKKLQNRVEGMIAEVKDLKAKSRPNRRVVKQYQQMTNKELDVQKARIEQIMATKILNKREQTQLNNTIYKIQRIKQEPNRNIQQDPSQVDDQHAKRIHELETEIKRLRDIQNKIKAERTTLFEQRDELEFKIDDIKEDVEAFIAKAKQVADLADSNQNTQKLKQQSTELKQSIYKLRDDIKKINEDYEAKLNEYETEQEKIKWIGWATKIQDKRRQQWEEEKAQRKKQKARQKTNTDKGDTKGEKETGAQQKPAFERKKINRNQKEIDNCTFLIDYCKRLYPQASGSENNKGNEKKQVNVEDQLKKGTWAKEKGVQIIKSKKSKVDEEDQPSKGGKYGKKKVQKEQQAAPSNRFAHDYFVAQTFDAVKVLPPTNVEELDKIIKDLEDKVEYYLSHPDQTVEQKFAKDKQYISKAGEKDDRKNTKTRGPKKNVINTEEFPSL